MSDGMNYLSVFNYQRSIHNRLCHGQSRDLWLHLTLLFHGNQEKYFRNLKSLIAVG